MTMMETRAATIALRRVWEWWEDGKGEEGGDNMGPFVDVVLGARGRRWAWCALMIREAYAQALLSAPGMNTAALVINHPWLWRVPPKKPQYTGGTPEPGALRLLTGMAKAGSRFTDPVLAIPGDAILYKRRGGHHAKMVKEHSAHGIIVTLEGNVGRAPAPIKKLACDPLRDRDFCFFATLRRGVK